jgi:hypothetical protein
MNMAAKVKEALWVTMVRGQFDLPFESCFILTSPGCSIIQSRPPKNWLPTPRLRRLL